MNYEKYVAYIIEKSILWYLANNFTLVILLLLKNSISNIHATHLVAAMFLSL